MNNTYPPVSGKYLINGKWLEGKKFVDVKNPASISEVVGQVALCTSEDVNEALAAAQSAYQKWSRTSPEERVKAMKQAAEALRVIVEENVSLFVRENGKVLVEAKKDISRCVDVMVNGADTLLEWMKPVNLDGTGTQEVMIRRRPRGVAAVISPWNSPMILTFKRVVPAILTGNTVVFKPATDCPLTIMNCLKAIEPFFPNGVINIVTGSGAVVGDLLTQDPRVRTISFVGGTDTGKRIMSLSASTVKKLYMELGGNDPAIILADAELDDSAIQRLKMGALRAAGQVCSAIKRIYVHESRYDELVTKLSHSIKRVVVGNGLNPDSTMGPLNNRSQYEYVNGLLERAREQGANVNTLGQQLDADSWEEGYFMLPSIVTGLHQQSELVQSEQFGPIIPILKFSDEEEAVTMANDTPFGLRASVWTSNKAKAAELADRLEAGAVFYNNHSVFQDVGLDFPGLKESGLSRETRFGGLELFADSYGFAD